MNYTHHRTWEENVINAMYNVGWDLNLSENEYEHYDAYGKTPKGFDCVIELKRRHKYYPDKVMEVYKYERLMEMECLIIHKQSIHQPLILALKMQELILTMR